MRIVNIIIMRRFIRIVFAGTTRAIIGTGYMVSRLRRIKRNINIMTL